MRARLLALALAAGACSGTPLAVAAQEPPGPWCEAISAHVFVEASYSYDFQHPASDLNALRVFDYDDREIKLDVAELVVQRPASQPKEFGFRVDATVGQSLPRLTAANGLFRDTRTGEAHDYDLHQILVSWIAPVGKGLRLDAGKFATPFGMEVIEGYDGWNDEQTRSLLFGFAIPFTHTGLRATYAFTGKASGSVAVVQGWDNWKDNNGAKSVLAQLALTPSPRWTVYLNAMAGPERSHDARHRRALYNAVATCKATDRLTVGLDAVVGTEQALAADGGDARWSGAAAYLRFAFGGRFALSARAELFDDPDGVRTGTAQRVREVTVTPEWTLGTHFLLRGDLRRDWSDAAVFERAQTPVTGQTTATVALLFHY